MATKLLDGSYVLALEKFTELSVVFCLNSWSCDICDVFLLILWHTHSLPFTAVTGPRRVCATCNRISLLSSWSTHNKAPPPAVQIEIDEVDVYLELESSLLFIYHLEFDYGSCIQDCVIWDNDVKLWYFQQQSHKWYFTKARKELRSMIVDTVDISIGLCLTGGYS